MGTFIDRADSLGSDGLTKICFSAQGITEGQTGLDVLNQPCNFTDKETKRALGPRQNLRRGLESIPRFVH